MPDPLPPPAPVSAPPADHAQPRWWFRLIRAVLNVALLGLLGLQLFALFLFSSDKHLPLPAFAQRALEQRLQEQGLSVKFSSLEVSPSGSLLLLDPKVYLAGTAEPVVEAEYVFVEPDWLTLLLSHRLSFSQLRFGNATFYCPPENSPTGAREVFISQFGAGLASEGNHWWRLDFLRGNFLGLEFSSRGTFTVPANLAQRLTPTPQPTPPPTPTPTAKPLAARYREWARAMINLQPQFSMVEKPAIEVQVSGDNSGVNTLAIAARADSARPPVPGLELMHPRIKLDVNWDGAALNAIGPAKAWVSSAKYAAPGEGNSAAKVEFSGPVWAQVQLAEGAEGIFSGRPLRAVLHSVSAQAGDFPLDGMEAKVDLRSWPSLPFSAAATHGQDTIRLSGQAEFDEENGDLKWRGGTVTTQIQASFATVLVAAHEQLPERLQGLKFDAPLNFDATASFDPSGKLQTADMAVRTEGTHFEQINLASVSARARLAYDDQGALTINVTQAYLDNPGWQVTGSYFQNLQTDDFILRVRGSLEPRVLDPYMEPWWGFVWDFVKPGSEWPQADVVYAGNWKGPDTQNAILVSAQIANASARGVPMNKISVRVEQRPEILSVYDIAGQAADGGELQGAIFWTMQPPYEHVYEERLIFDTTLPLPAVGAIGGPDAAEVVKPLASKLPPVIHFDERVGGSANPQPDVSVSKVQAEFSSPLSIFHVPLDNAVVEATVYPGFTDISHLEFGLAGGHATANATVTSDHGGDELKFSLLLLDARHTDFLSALGQFSDAEKAPAQVKAASATTAANVTTNASGADSMLGDPAHPGQLDLALGGELRLGDPDTFTAEGRLRLRDAQLGKLQLLGGLSRLLADTQVPLGEFSLNSAISDVQIAHGYLRLPNLVVTGPTARIVAAGTYHIDGGDLDFNALIFPVGQWDSMVLKQIANILNPFSNTVTLKLHAKIEKPEWNLSMNPLRLFENQTIEGPAIPGLPTDANGETEMPPLPPAPPLPALPTPPAQ